MLHRIFASSGFQIAPRIEFKKSGGKNHSLMHQWRKEFIRGSGALGRRGSVDCGVGFAINALKIRLGHTSRGVYFMGNVLHGECGWTGW